MSDDWFDDIYLTDAYEEALNSIDEEAPKEMEYGVVSNYHVGSDRCPREALAELLGPDIARQAVEAGWNALRPLLDIASQTVEAGWNALRPLLADRPPLVHPGLGRHVAATVILGAMPALGAASEGLSRVVGDQLGETLIRVKNVDFEPIDDEPVPSSPDGGDPA